MLGHCHEAVTERFFLFFSAFGPREALLEAMFGRAPSTTALVGEAHQTSWWPVSTSPFDCSETALSTVGKPKA